MDPEAVKVKTAQLSVLNERSRWYTARLWQVPFAFLGLSGAAIIAALEKCPVYLFVILIFSGCSGFLIIWHMCGLAQRVKQIVIDMQNLESALCLEGTAKYLPSLTRPFFIILSVFSLLCIAAGILLLRNTIPIKVVFDMSGPSFFFLSSFFSFVLGAITAVFAEPLRQYLFRPVLKLSFSGGDDCITRTPTSDGSEAIYIRIKVTNLKARLAKACQAYLIKVENKGTASGFSNTLYVDSLQLAWSCKVQGAERNPLDIPNGVAQYVDVIATSKSTNTFHLQVSPFPHRYKSLFSVNSETYRLTIQVSGDGMEPQTIKIVFVWKGQWDTIEAREDN